MAAYKEMPGLFITMSKVKLCQCEKEMVVGSFMHSTTSRAAVEKSPKDEAASGPPSAMEEYLAWCCGG